MHDLRGRMPGDAWLSERDVLNAAERLLLYATSLRKHFSRADEADTTNVLAAVESTALAVIRLLNHPRLDEPFGEQAELKSVALSRHLLSGLASYDRPDSPIFINGRAVVNGLTEDVKEFVRHNVPWHLFPDDPVAPVVVGYVRAISDAATQTPLNEFDLDFLTSLSGAMVFLHEGGEVGSAWNALKSCLRSPDVAADDISRATRVFQTVSAHLHGYAR